MSSKVIWIYGVPFCGKTTFANGFPDPLMINTAGNIKFVDAPYIHIKDDVRVEGRQTKRTLAWNMFKDTIAELEKKDNTFKTIVIDLLEDLYEHCHHRKREFLKTMKRVVNLDYDYIILISHQANSKDNKPNIEAKVAAKVTNMVDVVEKIVIKDGVRLLENSLNIF